MWFIKSNFQHFTIESNNYKKKNNSKGKHKSNSEDESDSENQSQNSEEHQKDSDDQEDENDLNSRDRSFSYYKNELRPDFDPLTTQRTDQIYESLYKTNDQYSKSTLFSQILP